MDLQDLLNETVDHQGESLSLLPDRRPQVINQRKAKALNEQHIPAKECEEICLSILDESLREELVESGFVNVCLRTKKGHEFRGHLFFQRGKIGGLFKHFREFKIEELNLPQVVMDFTLLPKGLVIFSGGTNSGKSSSVKALLKKMMSERSVHLLTVEDPVENLLDSESGNIVQIDFLRDLGAEVSAESLLQKGCDVYVLDMGLKEQVFETAITLVECGKLVFMTTPFLELKSIWNYYLRSNSESNEMRALSRLSSALQGICIQELTPSTGGGVLPVTEVLVNSPEIQSCISNNKFAEIMSLMGESVEKTGMRTFNQSLLHLILRRKIEIKEAFQMSRHPEELDQLLKKAGV